MQNPFWDFSLDFYGRPGVSAACLALQDEAGLDVNIVLFCIWAAQEGGGQLDEATMRRCIGVTSGWQAEIVTPLRELRRHCKDGVTLAPAAQRDLMHRELAAAELHAEHVEQDLLLALAPELHDLGNRNAATDAAASLAAYSAVAGVTLGDREQRHILALLAAI